MHCTLHNFSPDVYTPLDGRFPSIPSWSLMDRRWERASKCDSVQMNFIPARLRKKDHPINVRLWLSVCLPSNPWDVAITNYHWLHIRNPSRLSSQHIYINLMTFIEYILRPNLNVPQNWAMLTIVMANNQVKFWQKNMQKCRNQWINR